MRRILPVLVVLFLVLAPLSSNPATLYSLDSQCYEDLVTLYVSQGMALPSTSLPCSREELAFHLAKLEREALSARELVLYDALAEKVTESDTAFSSHLTLSLESYLHPNTTDFTTEDDWAYSYLDRQPLLSIPLEISLGNFYGVTELIAANRNVDGYADGKIYFPTSELFGEKSFTTNIPFDSEYFDSNIPYRAFLAVGGTGWLFQLGRDRLSWGPGMSGNFMIGNQVQYHNMGRLTAYRDNFKYTFLTSFFPHPDEIFDTNLDTSQARPLVGLKLFMAHRFEWRLLDDKLGLVLNEGIMYQSGTGTFDLRILNPFMLYHNYFIRSNANSLASLEVDYTPARRWNLYGQFVLDELALGSAEWDLEDGRHPNGLGYMLGIRMEKPLHQGFLRAQLEGVYTDPYLYLRSLNGDETQLAAEDNLNYVVAIRRWYPEQVVYDQEFLGYRYGGDAIVVNAEVEYRVPDCWYIKGRLFGMLQGEMTMMDLWTLDDLDSTPTGSPTFTMQSGVSLGWQKEDWSFFGSLDYLAEVKEYTLDYDLQLVMGASCSLW